MYVFNNLHGGIMGTLFGTDGIRGEANRHPMDAFIAFAVGQAVTHVLKKKGAHNAGDHRQGHAHFRLYAGERS